MLRFYSARRRTRRVKLRLRFASLKMTDKIEFAISCRDGRGDPSPTNELFVLLPRCRICFAKALLFALFFVLTKNFAKK